MTTYIVTSKEWTLGCMGEAYCNDRVKALVSQGAVHRDIEDIEREPAKQDDVVISFVHPPNSRFQSAVLKKNRWLFAVDETIGSNGIYEKQIRRCRENGLGGVVTTYGNEAHLQRLHDADLKVCYYPLVMGPERVRKSKPGRILCSGQIDPRVYPERHRLAGILSSQPGFAALQHPGYWPSPMAHQFTGDKYLDLLDEYELVIVDRAGSRDRFVAKYYEAAACHALPIGDIPSYMPSVLREHMINTDGMTNDEVRAEVTCLLAAPAVLLDMQKGYEKMMRFLYDPIDTAMRVMWEVNR